MAGKSRENHGAINVCVALGYKTNTCTYKYKKIHRETHILVYIYINIYIYIYIYTYGNVIKGSDMCWVQSGGL